MKKAVLFGLNYENSSSQLNGCINDTIEMQNILVDKFNYDEVELLSDHTNKKPTKENIIKAIENIVSQSKECSEIFIHYSGHGSSIHDYNSDEKDKMDEVLVPLDYDVSGIISDDQLNDLVSKTECCTRVILDCCHSGSGLDLYYNSKVVDDKVEKYRENNDFENNKNKIIMLSGCLDHQVSYDAYNTQRSKYMGALTSSFLRVLNESDYNISINDMLLKLYQILGSGGFDQKPVLSSNQEIDLEMEFISTKILPLLPINNDNFPIPSPLPLPTPNNDTQPPSPPVLGPSTPPPTPDNYPLPGFDPITNPMSNPITPGESGNNSPINVPNDHPNDNPNNNPNDGNEPVVCDTEKTECNCVVQ
jgi:metacaspase-1